MATIASVLWALVQAVILFCLAYHYLLLVASVRRPAPRPVAGARHTRFAIAIPAHDEAAVLPSTLAQLRRQDYPPGLFDVHVVADHCTDDTARLGRQGGAVVHERSSLPRGRKAYALRWLLDRILQAQPPYDAVAVFDADSRVGPDFLATMEAYLSAGELVLQGQHVVDNPHDSLLAAVAAVDMRLNNRLRNQGRCNLGLSSRLMGDAMVFDIGLLRAHGWPGESLIEDREVGYELLLRGNRVRYVPQATSYGQAAAGWKQAQPQRLRWYRGVVDMQRRLAGRLLVGALRSASPLLLDAALELLMPSYSFLVAASVVNLALVLAAGLWLPSLRGLMNPLGAALLLAAWAIYPLLGLLVDRAPAWAFRALLLGPAYLAWRLWISILVRLRGDRIRWIRTRRREETEEAAS